MPFTAWLVTTVKKAPCLADSHAQCLKDSRCCDTADTSGEQLLPDKGGQATPVKCTPYAFDPS